jgi:hypothetical protein
MKYYALFFLAFLFLGCEKQSKQEFSAKEAALVEAAAPENSPTTSSSHQDMVIPDSYAQSKAKLIRTADYRFKVANVRKVTELIETAVTKYPAYLSGSRLTMEDGLIQNNMTIRVQAEYFDALLKDIDSFSIETHQREVVTSDVGKEYVDLEGRLKTKREVEERYKAILRKNTGTIEEILAAERQIGQIHEEIESTIGRLNYLKEQINYSTIRLEFYEPVVNAIAKQDPLYQKFIHAFTSGFHGAVEILISLTYLWPLYVLVICGYYLFRLRKIRA